MNIKNKESYISKPILKNGLSGLQQLSNYLKEDLTKVDEMIEKALVSHVGLIGQVAGQIISAGGKRVRPLLTLAMAQWLGKDKEYNSIVPIQLATSVELIHTATLLHDDVLDNSEVRRGKQTAKSLWGNMASVLVGDFLFSQSFQLMVSTKSFEMLSCLSKTASIIVEGELRQIQMQGRIDSSVDEYLKMIDCKTSQLFATAARVGAMASGSSEQESNTASDIGRLLGQYFQITDDVLDYKLDSKKLGKPVGQDFIGGKITYPVLIAYSVADNNDKTAMKGLIEKESVNTDDLNAIMGYINKYNGLEKSIDKARQFSELAKNKILEFPDHPIKDILTQVMNDFVNRQF